MDEHELLEATTLINSHRKLQRVYQGLLEHGWTSSEALSWCLCEYYYRPQKYQK